jgi:hypothetical protein
MILLPQLIKEKVEYYYYRHYQELWLEKIKIMHQEYRKQVVVFENPFGNNVSWKIKNTRHSFVSICKLRQVSHQDFQEILGVYRYVDATSTSSTTPILVANLPKYYYYSSGLNDPNGYK